MSRTASSQLDRYDTVGVLEKIISDGSLTCDLTILNIARFLGFKTGGFCPISVKAKHITRYRLQIFDREWIKEGLDEKTGKYTYHWEDVTQHFCRRAIKNIEQSDATLILDLEPAVYISKIIGYCVCEQLIEIPQDYSEHPFYYWPDRNVFVVNSLTRDAAKNLRRWLVLNKIKKLCIITEFDATEFPIHSFLEIAFTVKVKPELS